MISLHYDLDIPPTMTRGLGFPLLNLGSWPQWRPRRATSKAVESDRPVLTLWIHWLLEPRHVLWGSTQVLGTCPPSPADTSTPCPPQKQGIWKSDVSFDTRYSLPSWHYMEQRQALATQPGLNGSFLNKNDCCHLSHQTSHRWQRNSQKLSRKEAKW